MLLDLLIAALNIQSKMNNSVSYDTGDDDRYVSSNNQYAHMLSASPKNTLKQVLRACICNSFQSPPSLLTCSHFVSLRYFISFLFFSVLFSPHISISGASTTRPPIKYLNVPESFSNCCLFCYFIAPQFNTFICFVQISLLSYSFSPSNTFLIFHCYFVSYSILSLPPNPRFI
jgi:hypothetical protein